MLGIVILSVAVGLAAAQAQPNATTSPPPSAGFSPICDPDNFMPGAPSPLLPDLPNQFSFTIEGNLVERNTTAVITEYYDRLGDRGRIEFGFNGSSTMGIFDYNLGEVFFIPDLRGGDDCRVYPISDSSRFINRTFGIVHENGSIHIGSPRTFLEGLRDDTITRYIGEDMVRGIPTQRWQACFGAENISYLIDYHFVAEEWNYEGQTQMVPVQFTLNTSRLVNGTVRNIYHIYSVVDFRAGPESVPETLFRVPNGLACTGRFPGQPVPQIPQFFSTYVERVYRSTNFNGIQTWREFYDLPNKLYRVDVYYSGRQGGAPGPVSIIHDFDTSVQYLVGTQVLNCSAQPFSQSQFTPFFPDIVSNDDGSFQLVSPTNFFFLGSEFNYSYEGVSNIRGVDVDSWVSVRDFERLAAAVNLTNGVYEVFFTRPGWIYSTDRSINSDPVPWRINIVGGMSILNMTDNSTFQVNGTFQLDYFDFSTDEPNYDAFDIVSLCAAPEDYHTILLIIPGQEKGIDFGQLRRNIRTSVSNYTGVKPLQIGNIQIVRENGTHLYVVFHISNLSSAAAPSVPNPVTSDKAVQILTNNTVNSMLPFKIKLSENNSVSPILHEVGRGNRNRTSSCNSTTTNNGTNCKPNITNQLGLTDNIVAGIAVGLFVLGLALGIVIVLVCVCCACCWRSTSTYDVQRSKAVKYEKQVDDVHVT